MNRKSGKIKTALFISLTVICLAVLCFSLYQALKIYIPQQQEQDRFEQLREMIVDESVLASDSSSDISFSSEEEKKSSEISDYTSLAAINDDMAGWLRIDDTLIDYPVMKSSEDDPEFYLHRDFDKNYSFSGCLFVGGGCDTESDVFVIYGHNMNNGSMFGTLDNYHSDEWTKEHRDIEFDTLTEHRVYRVFASFQTKIYEANENVFKYYDSVGNFSEEAYTKLVENINNMSEIHLFEKPEYPQQIIFLSTCSYHTDDGRFVVAAYRVE